MKYPSPAGTDPKKSPAPDVLRSSRGSVPFWRRPDALATILSGLLPFVIYLGTLSPTIAGGDSGELVTVAYLGGVAHPPGYPLYTMAAKLLTLLPVGTVAWRVNLLSALCDALAAMFLFRAVFLWTRDVAAGALAAGAFAFSRLIWPFAVTAEVFAMNNLFAAGMLYLAARAAFGWSEGIAYAGAFWTGLGLTNHHTLVFYAVPLLGYLLLRAGPRAWRPGFWLRFGGAFLAGLLPYVYLPLAGATPPAVSWGDTSTWRGFLVHVLRREYGSFRLSVGFGGGGAFLPWFATFWSAVLKSTWYAGLPLLIASLAIFRRPGPTRALAGLWLIALLLYLAVFCTLTNVRLDLPLHVSAQERFWELGTVVVCAFLGVGLAEVARWFPRGRAVRARWIPALGLPLALAVTEAPDAKRHGSTFIRDYGESILRSVEPNGLLIATGDEAVNGVDYVQHVEGVRPDVRAVPLAIVRATWFPRFAALHLPGVEPPRPRLDFKGFVDSNVKRFPFYLCNRERWETDEIKEAYTIWPMGLVDQVLPKGMELEPGAWVRRAEASFARIDPRRVRGFPAGSWERAAEGHYWESYERLGYSLAEFAGRHPEPAAFRALIRVYETLAAREPDAPPVVWGNLGLAYYKLSQTEPAALGPMVRSWRRYLAMNPVGDPHLAQIRAVVEQAERALAAKP